VTNYRWSMVELNQRSTCYEEKEKTAKFRIPGSTRIFEIPKFDYSTMQHKSREVSLPKISLICSAISREEHSLMNR